jgi:hypothetical protein
MLARISPDRTLEVLMMRVCLTPVTPQQVPRWQQVVYRRQPTVGYPCDHWQRYER